MKIRKSRFFDSHTKGKPTLSHKKYANATGVYFIRSKRTGKIDYIGSSAGSLYKTIYRHFQQWTDRQRSGKQFDRTTYAPGNWEICVILTTTGSQALRVEKYFIQKLQPAGNPIKYEQLQLSLNDSKEIAQAWESAGPIYKTEIEDAPF